MAGLNLRILQPTLQVALALFLNMLLTDIR